MLTRSCFLIGFCAFAPTAFSQNLSLQPIVTSGLNSPLYVTAAPGDDNRLFIVEKGGAVRLFDRTTGTLQTTPYLNLSSSVSASGERGLLGLAFDPDFASNGRLYVNYTNTDGDIVIARHVANGNALTSTSASSAGILMMDPIEHSLQSNHNGGWIGFKPSQAGNNTPAVERHHLYISVGDGGGSNDPNDNGQNTNTVLGAMLRIDVSGDGVAAIPSSNPFVAAPGADEIWDYGLRNAWRNSFDRETGDLWIADVGQGAFEEINFHGASDPSGLNFGWAEAEGTSGNPLFTDPVYAYPHVPAPPSNGSVTGGYVYRGENIPSLEGRYFFGDYLSGQIFSFVFDGLTVSDLKNHTEDLLPTGPISFGGGLVSFGEDAAGELYLVDIRGAVYQIVPEPASIQLLLTAVLLKRLCRFRHRTSSATRR
jgi:glucose/arabinose dehydrogenase